MLGVMYRRNEFFMQLYALVSYGVYFLHAMMPMFVFAYCIYSYLFSITMYVIVQAFPYSVQEYIFFLTYKRRRLNQRNFIDAKRQKARVLIGKPKQSSMNIALQLKEVSEYLSSNGFPSAAQFVDVAKPEPERMDLDVSVINLPMAAAPPAPAPAPPARRGGRRANAQPQDLAPQPVTPEVQAQINAFYSLSLIHI